MNLIQIYEQFVKKIQPTKIEQLSKDVMNVKKIFARLYIYNDFYIGRDMFGVFLNKDKFPTLESHLENSYHGIKRFKEQLNEFFKTYNIKVVKLANNVSLENLYTGLNNGIYTIKKLLDGIESVEKEKNR